MCGIVGVVGHAKVKNYLIEGLKTLEYRGYDSSGVAFAYTNEPVIYRLAGRVAALEKEIPDSLTALLGIGHTRWATHGAPTTINAHPHVSSGKKFTLVHNGVIDNFRSLKMDLQKKGFVFVTETDTEVISNLLEDNFKTTKDVLKAISKTMKMLDGSFALVIIHQGDSEKLYFAKNHSPLLIGHGTNENFLASDYLPMVKFAKEFITLSDYQYGYISKSDVNVYDLEKGKLQKNVYHATDIVAEDINLEGYPHYMLKEIEEAPKVIRRLIDNYYDGVKFSFPSQIIEKLKASDNIVFIACGTSYHACLIGRRYFQEMGKTAEVHIASEWAYYPTFTGKNPHFIIVSQSGETADLIHCVNVIKKAGYPILTITNKKGSSLDRAANDTLLLYAGIEVSVASTKAYVAQVALLSLLTKALSGNLDIITNLHQVIYAQKQVVERRDRYKKIADFLSTKLDVFFLGRGFDFDVSLEASLKLKEITYIHSEGLPGGELKHGPIALIEKGTPVVVFISDPKTSLAIRSNIQEVLARGAKVIVISSQPLAREEDDIVVPEVPVYLSPLVTVIIGQYLAYYAALKLGKDIDKPRNLAKSVTVE